MKDLQALSFLANGESYLEDLLETYKKIQQRWTLRGNNILKKWTMPISPWMMFGIILKH